MPSNQVLDGRLQEQRTVLVVEDDAVLREFMTEILTLEGYAVLQAEDGPDGLRLAHEHQPSVILLDGLLPRISGLEVLRQLQASERTAAIPVILVSGLGAALDDAELRPAGLLPKPFDIEALFAQVTRLSA